MMLTKMERSECETHLKISSAFHANYGGNHQRFTGFLFLFDLLLCVVRIEIDSLLVDFEANCNAIGLIELEGRLDVHFDLKALTCHRFNVSLDRVRELIDNWIWPLILQ